MRRVEEDTYKHSKECVERFKEAFGSNREDPAPRMLALEDIGDVEVESIATPSSGGYDILDEPPDEEELVDRGEMSRPAMTAEVAYGKGRDSLDVEMSCTSFAVTRTRT